MKSKVLILVLFAAAAIAILFFSRQKASMGAPASATPEHAASAPPPPPKAQVEIPFVYSTEKKEWVEAAVAEFSTSHPEVKVVLTGKGSLEASDAILDGSL